MTRRPQFFYPLLRLHCQIYFATERPDCQPATRASHFEFPAELRSFFIDATATFDAKMAAPAAHHGETSLR